LTTPGTKAVAILLLLCGMVIPIIQVQVAIGRPNGGGGDGGGGNGGGGGRGGNLPSPPSNPQRPTVNQPTARPTFAQSPTVALPTARPTFTSSPTRSVATSFSFSRTIQTSFTYSGATSFSFTRTVITQTSYTFNPTFTMTTNYGTTYTNNYWYPGMPFIHYGYGYSSSTGSFTLGQTLYNQNNSPCLYYDYFEFNAAAGMTVQARLWTTGPSIDYIVVPMPVVSLFQSSGCSAIAALYTQTNTITTTPILYSWTAPQNGQYAVIFYSTTPYTAPIYFLPQ